MVVAGGSHETVTVDLASARAALAAEWAAARPHGAQGVAAQSSRQVRPTSAEVASFYRNSECLAAELDAWHATPSRQEWTRAVGYVARMVQAKAAVDIGCGAGYELRELADNDVDVVGVEPNRLLASRLREEGFHLFDDAWEAPIDAADLLVLLDVLEHLPEPQKFVDAIARRAKIGATLVESTASDDMGTPLHLEHNFGWHPGQVLETHGWELLDVRGRLRVWQRIRFEAPERAGILLCAYRALSVPTANSVIALMGRAGWRITTKSGDGLISRARSVVASRWWCETADDVFVMIDDDMAFAPDAAEQLVARCREGYDVVCAAYPVRSGAQLSCRSGGASLEFGPGLPPVEIQYAATGFLAVHRRVLDALIPTLQRCHENEPWAFWPMFEPMVVEQSGGVHFYLSEDWAFCERARAAGFPIWLDPSIRVGHLAQIEIDVSTMDRAAALMRSE